MRLCAFAVFALVASGCSIHVVEQPATPVVMQAANPVPIRVADPPLLEYSRVISHPTPRITVKPEPRPERAERPESPLRTPFKGTPPEPRSSTRAAALRTTTSQRAHTTASNQDVLLTRMRLASVAKP